MYQAPKPEAHRSHVLSVPLPVTQRWIVRMVAASERMSLCAEIEPPSARSTTVPVPHDRQTRSDGRLTVPEGESCGESWDESWGES